MHVEDIVGRDGGHAAAGLGLGRGHLVGDEAEGRAAARAAFHLQEQEVIASSKEADPIGGDALLADGASETVEERAKVILRIHPRELYGSAHWGVIGNLAADTPRGYHSR